VHNSGASRAAFHLGEAIDIFDEERAAAPLDNPNSG
jgi:hypothetical protein